MVIHSRYHRLVNETVQGAHAAAPVEQSAGGETVEPLTALQYHLRQIARARWQANARPPRCYFWINVTQEVGSSCRP